ncbi:MAG: N-6 DNA methylase [Spirochaeta sp.]|nr:N-6 DNA methylase [Spirochaeta sp.]
MGPRWVVGRPLGEKHLRNAAAGPCRLRLLAAHHRQHEDRQRAQSFLTDEHIQHIVAVYQAFGEEDGFARKGSNDEIREKGNNLSIPLYVRTDNANGNGSAETISLEQVIADWQESSTPLRESMEGLFTVLEETRMTGGDQ